MNRKSLKSRKASTATTAASSSSASSSSTSISSLLSTLSNQNDAPSNVEYTVTQHYYADNDQHRFEQSMDIYTPTNNTSPTGVVALVMGSGWLGHQPYVYCGTNWWNASAPKTICGKLGYICVTIRHSGGFPKLPNPFHALSSNTSAIVTLSSIPTPILILLHYGKDIMTTEQQQQQHHRLLQAMVVLFVLCSLYAFLYCQGRNAATFKDMVHDVSKALQYIDKHAIDWWGGITKTNTTSKIPIVFGGYSSGGHVAATVLASSSMSPLSPTSTMSLKNIDIVSVLYLSGVLDVSSKDSVMTIVTMTALGQWPTTVPSPLLTLKEQITTTNTTTTKMSSITKMTKYPRHILIGCQNEVFGLPILKSAFCSQEYAELLNSHHNNNDNGNDKDNNNDIDPIAECILLPQWTVNHWSVLSSVALRDALQESLAKVFDNGAKKE